MRSLQFDLDYKLRLFNLEGRKVILDPVHLKRLASKANGSAIGNTQSERQKFINRCSDISKLSRDQVLQVLSTFMKFLPIEKVLGFYYKGSIRFHYLADPIRFRHILGLSDAVDQAMSNFGLTVQFPVTNTRVVPMSRVGGRKFLNGNRVFSVVKSSPRGTYLQLKIRTKGGTTRHRRYRLLVHYLRVFPKERPEKDYVKMIKTSLAGLFSEQMDQELPEGYPENSIPIFPPFSQERLNRALLNKKLRVQFYFNILQSKALCAPVGEDMIEEQYLKHFSSLCRDPSEVLKVPEEMLEDLRAYGRKVGKRVKDIYDPYRTSLPNQMSSIEANREEGGNREALKQSGTLRSYRGSSLSHMMRDSENPRLEPFVVGFFGPPGCGKTTMVNRLVSKLRSELFPGLSRENAVYSRSCATAHWDGYSEQPIVILDDFGQNLEDRGDLSEFEILVSINDYVLPMAELSQKGTKFRSPILIITSNMEYGCSQIRNGTQGLVVEDPLAVWRRFDLPYLLFPNPDPYMENFFFQLTPPSVFSTTQSWDFYRKKYGKESPMWTSLPFSGITLGQPGEPILLPTPEGEGEREKMYLNNNPSHLGKRINRQDIFQSVIQGVRKKWDFHQSTFHDSWTQVVHRYRIDFQKPEGCFWHPLVSEVSDDCCPNSVSTVLDFPISPPSSAPVVKAHAIPEPLKVRMITLGESDTKVLQPFQKALWTYLSEQPQFCLTNGVKTLESFEGETLPWIHRIEEVIHRIEKRYPMEKDIWLSGDYTAATDNFPMSVTEALVEGILEEIDHQPTKDWVRWEISPHEMRYPRDLTGVQTSGQLMGSLLSFPLLCFLNDYIVSSSGFASDSYLVNGDDVVAKGSMESILKWKERAPKVGLSLSVGKNFYDPDFCTVNSQLFYKGSVLHTGKVSTQKREGTTLSYCFAEAQFYWGDSQELKENFLLRNLNVLSRSPRSLHFSVKHGGLGLYDTQGAQRKAVDVSLAKRVYLNDVLSPFSKVVRVPGAPFSFVCLPQIIGEKALENEDDQFLLGVRDFNRFQEVLDSKTEAQYDDLSHSELRRKEEARKSRQSPHFHNLFNHLVKGGSFDLEQAPELGSLKRLYVAVSNGAARKLALRSEEYALRMTRELWEDPRVHPLEWTDGGLVESLAPYEEECTRLDLPHVRLFEDEHLWVDPENEEERISPDVIKFWSRMEPGQLESKVGGELDFSPRPQSTLELDRFLNFYYPPQLEEEDDVTDNFHLREQSLSLSTSE